MQPVSSPAKCRQVQGCSNTGIERNIKIKELQLAAFHVAQAQYLFLEFIQFF